MLVVETRNYGGLPVDLHGIGGRITRVISEWYPKAGKEGGEGGAVFMTGSISSGAPEWKEFARLSHHDEAASEEVLPVSNWKSAVPKASWWTVFEEFKKAIESKFRSGAFWLECKGRMPSWRAFFSEFPKGLCDLEERLSCFKEEVGRLVAYSRRAGSGVRGGGTDDSDISAGAMNSILNVSALVPQAADCRARVGGRSVVPCEGHFGRAPVRKRTG